MDVVVDVDVCTSIFYLRICQGSPSDEVTFSRDLRELREQVLHLGGESHFRETRMCKGPEAGACSVHLRNSKAATVAGIERARDGTGVRLPEK